MQAVLDLRSTDLSMWASRYNLFVLWSADRQHPWDGLPGAETIAATLEIGKAEADDKVCDQECFTPSRPHNELLHRNRACT